MGNLTANTDLFAPIDLARFALAYIVLIVIPGYALAALARPRASRVELLAFAIPCSYGLVAICGVTTALAHLPFDVPAYGALALPMTMIGGLVSRHRHMDGRGNEGRWWLIAGGVALAQTTAIAIAYAGQTTPVGFDSLSHVTWTTDIARARIFPLALLSAHLDSSDGGFYPPVFHAVTALVLRVAPMPTYRAVVYSVMATTTMLPLALFCYVHMVTKSDRLAGLAALASLSFEPLPFSVVSLALYPFTVSLLIAPMLAIALGYGLGYGCRRATVLAALLGIGLFYTHPTEFVTAGLLTLAILSGILIPAGRPQDWGRAALHGAGVAAAWLVAATPVIRAVRSTIVNGAQVEIRTVHDFSRPATIHLGATLDSYVQWIYGRNISYLLLAATIIGLIWCVARRRYAGLAVVGAITVILSIDSMSYNLLRPLYVLSFPWALLERLGPTHYWIVLPLAALGIDAIARSAARLGQFRHMSPRFVVMAATPLVLIGLLLPFAVATGRVAAYARARKIVAPADLGALAWLARNTPSGAVVVNDGDMSHLDVFDAPIDAGRWMPVLGGPQPLFWKLGGGPGPLADRFYLLQHIADTPLPARAARYVQRYHVRFVFYGAAARPGAARHLNLQRLLADPQLRLVYRNATGCGHSVIIGDTTCRQPGSYIFRVQPAIHQPTARRGTVPPVKVG